jgi:hypothetical protein
MFHQQTQELQVFAQQLPDWATVSLFTTFQRAFTF